MAFSFLVRPFLGGGYGKKRGACITPRIMWNRVDSRSGYHISFRHNCMVDGGMSEGLSHKS